MTKHFTDLQLLEHVWSCPFEPFACDAEIHAAATVRVAEAHEARNKFLSEKSQMTPLEKRLSDNLRIHAERGEKCTTCERQLENLRTEQERNKKNFGICHVCGAPRTLVECKKNWRLVCSVESAHGGWEYESGNHLIIDGQCRILAPGELVKCAQHEEKREASLQAKKPNYQGGSEAGCYS